MYSLNQATTLLLDIRYCTDETAYSMACALPGVPGASAWSVVSTLRARAPAPLYGLYPTEVL